MVAQGRDWATMGTGGLPKHPVVPPPARRAGAWGPRCREREGDAEIEVSTLDPGHL